MTTKKTRIGAAFARIAASVLVVLAAAPGIVDVLTLSPSSVAPTLATLHETSALRHGDSRGLIRSMQRAHREAVDRAWTDAGQLIESGWFDEERATDHPQKGVVPYQRSF